MIDSVIITIFVKEASLEDFLITPILRILHPWKFISSFMNQFCLHQWIYGFVFTLDQMTKIKLLLPGNFTFYVEVPTLHHHCCLPTQFCINACPSPPTIITRHSSQRTARYFLLHG